MITYGLTIVKVVDGLCNGVQSVNTHRHQHVRRAVCHHVL